MIKHFCDECEKEVETERFFCFLTLREINEGFAPGSDMGLRATRHFQERILHFCRKCACKLFPKIGLLP